MAGGISIHAVDLTRGEAAVGLLVELFDANDTLLAAGTIDRSGNPDSADLFSGRKTNGQYTVLFHVGSYYRQRGFAPLGIAFLDIVPYRFHSRDPEFHTHLPFKFSPWGFSCFRGN